MLTQQDITRARAVAPAGGAVWFVGGRLEQCLPLLPEGDWCKLEPIRTAAGLRTVRLSHSGVTLVLAGCEE